MIADLSRSGELNLDETQHEEQGDDLQGDIRLTWVLLLALLFGTANAACAPSAGRLSVPDVQSNEQNDDDDQGEDEDVQVLSNIIGVDPAKVAIDRPVKVTFDDVKEGLSIPKFTAA
jgi:hypothetical protein